MPSTWKISLKNSAEEALFPIHLRRALNNWHRKTPDEKPPPCTLVRRSNEKPGKTFSREHQEAIITKYTITSPVPYIATVFEIPGQPAKLITSAISPRDGFCFMVAWTGTDKLFENQCCAVRISRKDVKCTEKLWSRAPKLPIPSTCPDAKRTRASAPPTRNSSDTSRKRSLIVKLPANLPTQNSPEEKRPVDGEATESDAGEVSNRPTCSGKRLRVEPIENAAVMPDILVQFRHHQSGVILEYPLHECESGEQLFALAKSFFETFEENSDVSRLLCQFDPDRGQKRLLLKGKGSEGGFKLLVEEAEEFYNSLRKRVRICVYLPEYCR